MTILVTGATGSVGRAVVARLVSQGHQVRAVVRHPEAAALPAGVQIVTADFADPASIAAQVGDAEAAFLLWPFMAADLTARLAAQVIKAIGTGPRRIVYLSAPAAGADPGSSWGIVEDHIRRSGTGWTFLRPSGFAKNTLIWTPQIKAGDVVRWPYGRATRSLIHEDDIAAVAVAALTEEGHDRAVYTLTGPAGLAQAEQVEIIGEALGRPLRWEEMPAAEAIELLTAAFGDADAAGHTLDTWAGFVAEPEIVTSTVRQVTGRPARTFRDWVSEHAADFR